MKKKKLQKKKVFKNKGILRLKLKVSNDLLTDTTIDKSALLFGILNDNLQEELKKTNRVFADVEAPVIITLRVMTKKRKE